MRLVGLWRSSCPQSNGHRVNSPSGAKGRDMYIAILLCLVLRLRTDGAKPPVPYITSCQANTVTGLSLYSDTAMAPSSLLVNGYRCSFPVKKLPGRAVDHLSPSSAKIKNDWNHTFSPPIRLLRVDRYNFTFFTFLLLVVYVQSRGTG
jgi:hypothetical protein